MKIFITGTTGFVGSHVASSLITRGHEVMGLVRSSEDAENLEKQGIEPLISTLEKVEQLQRAASQCDGVFHGVASNNEDFQKINAKAVSWILEAIEGTNKAFVMQGGTMIFGDTGKKQLTEADAKFNAPLPLASRVTLEKKVLDLQHKGIRTAIVYGSWVYGAHGAAIPEFMSQAAKKHGYSAIPGDGKNMWATVHIKDWANLIALAMERPNASGMYFANTTTYMVKELAQVIADDLGITTQNIDLDKLENIWGPFTQPLAFMNQNFSSKKAEEELGWEPMHVLK